LGLLDFTFTIGVFAKRIAEAQTAWRICPLRGVLEEHYKNSIQKVALLILCCDISHFSFSYNTLYVKMYVLNNA